MKTERMSAVAASRRVSSAVLAWVLSKALKNRFSPDYYTPVEIGALYWHLVDLIWIYLFPLLYLVG